MAEQQRQSAAPSPLRRAAKIGYAGGELAIGSADALLYVLFLYFLTDTVGIKPGASGAIILVGSLYAAVLTPLVGGRSDRAVWRGERRRPFLLMGAVPLALATWLLFTDWGLSGVGQIAYFVVIISLFWSGWVVFYVPYAALSAELVGGYDERTDLVAYRNGAALLAGLVGTSGSLLLIAALSEAMGDALAWSATAALFAVVILGGCLASWRVTRGRERRTATRAGFRLTDVPGLLVHNRPFRYVVGLYAAASVALQVASTGAVYFMTYNMGFTESTVAVAFVVYFAGSLLWFGPVRWVGMRLGKRAGFQVFAAFWAVTYGVGMFLAPSLSLWFFWLVLVLGSVSAPTLYGFAWAMIPDCTEVDEYVTGMRREGLFFGVATFYQALAQAFAGLLVGATLGWIGYVAGAEQSSGTLLGIRLLLAEGVAGCVVLAMLCCWRMPLTRAKHAALCEALERRAVGETFDEAGFHDVLPRSACTNEEVAT